MSFLRFVTLVLAIALLPGSAAADDFHLEVDSGAWHPVHLDASDDEMTVDDRRAMQAQLKVRLFPVHRTRADRQHEPAHLSLGLPISCHAYHS